MSGVPFSDLVVAGEGASCLDLQLAIAGEFGPADAVVTQGLLDNRARALFGLAACGPEEQANALGTLLTREMGLRACIGADPGDLLLPGALQSGRGHPLMLAIIAQQLATRAGITTGVYSSRTRWFIGLKNNGQLLLLDAALDGSGRPPHVLAHCRHDLAYCALTGLSRSFASSGQPLSARRATRLKLALPIGDHLRREVQRELDALEHSEARP